MVTKDICSRTFVGHLPWHLPCPWCWARDGESEDEPDSGGPKGADSLLGRPVTLSDYGRFQTDIKERDSVRGPTEFIPASVSIRTLSFLVYLFPPPLFGRNSL